MEDDQINTVDRLILLALKKEGKPLSTYKIAKNANISWSTANTHCYKLRSIDLLNMRRVKNHFGQEKMMWRINEEQLKSMQKA